MPSSMRSIRPFSGIIHDIRARAPYYLSDWSDAFNYRVIPATLLIFFANVLPGIAFSLDLIETTKKYGVTEVLLSSFMAAFVFSVFGAQPLCIAGVTGPITVLNTTIFKILQTRPDAPDYLHFIGWVYFWGAILHWITAALNWCNFLKYVTRFSCDTFGFFVSWVYLQYGVQVLMRMLPSSSSSSTDASFLAQIILALIMVFTCFLFQFLARFSASFLPSSSSSNQLQPLFHRYVRRFLDDYGMPISLVATTALAYWGHLRAATVNNSEIYGQTLPLSAHAFEPASYSGRSGTGGWLVRFWELPREWVGIAFPFGVILWILFFFDHNVSSLIAQSSQFPLRKPPGFHYDFFLLGITTFIAGLLGIPAPNGLIPQAPIHTRALLIMGHGVKKGDIEDLKDGSTAASRPVTPLSNASNSSSIAPPRFTPAFIEPHSTVVSTLSDGNLLPEPDPHSYHDIARRRQVQGQEVSVGVVEQRVSNLAQGALALVLLSPPFLHLLHLIPKGVLAGLFWYMGIDALLSNGITTRLFYLLRDRHYDYPPPTRPKKDGDSKNDDNLHSSDDGLIALRRVRTSSTILFTLIQLTGFGITFAIVQTRASVGFPVIILLLVPLRTFVIPLLPFKPEELEILDGPTASAFTMEFVGGSNSK